MIEKLRKVIFRKPLIEPQNLNGRKFIVTGCSEGSIGYATAKTLLQWGAEVTITRRKDTDKLLSVLKDDLKLNEDRLFAHDLDLASAQSVNAFSTWYKNERKALDVLINNAGIHLDLLSKWKTPKLSADQHEIQWRTNYLGTVHLTHALLDLLLESANTTNDARVVNISSMQHSKGCNSEFFEPTKPYNSWEAYGKSKLGLMHFSQSLQTHYADQGLSAYSLHPGEVYSNVAGKGLEGNPLIETVRNALWPIEKFMMMTPFEGSQTTLLCATKDKQQLKGGAYYRNLELAEISEDAKDTDVAEQLWQANNQWLEQIK